MASTNGATVTPGSAMSRGRVLSYIVAAQIVQVVATLVIVELVHVRSLVTANRYQLHSSGDNVVHAALEATDDAETVTLNVRSKRRQLLEGSVTEGKAGAVLTLSGGPGYGTVEVIFESQQPPRVLCVAPTRETHELKGTQVQGGGEVGR